MKSKFIKDIYIGREFKLSNFDEPIKIIDARQNTDIKYTSNPKYVKNGLPIEVMFMNSNKYETSEFWCRYDSLTDRRGDKVRNYLRLNKFGCYYGSPKYKSTAKLQRCWTHMWERCNDPNRKAYINSSVSEEWRSYQKFLEWVYTEDSNYIENDEQDLDKDLFQLDVKDKIYSPDTCVFIPSELNAYMSGISKRTSTKMQSLYFRGNLLYISRNIIDETSSKYIRYYFLEEIIKRYRNLNELNHRAYRGLHVYNIKVNKVNINLVHKYIDNKLIDIINTFLDEIFKK